MLISLTSEVAREASVDVQKFTQIFHGTVLQLCAEYDAPRIQEQNQKLLQELSISSTIQVRKQVVYPPHMLKVHGRFR